jgi:hypothetical protein
VTVVLTSPDPESSVGGGECDGEHDPQRDAALGIVGIDGDPHRYRPRDVDVFLSRHGSSYCCRDRPSTWSSRSGPPCPDGQSGPGASAPAPPSIAAAPEQTIVVLSKSGAFCPQHPSATCLIASDPWPTGPVSAPDGDFWALGLGGSSARPRTVPASRVGNCFGSRRLRHGLPEAYGRWGHPGCSRCHPACSEVSELADFLRWIGHRCDTREAAM